MIKNCRITKIINPPIYGVTKNPIKEGNIVPLNSGQILACLGVSVVDEVLETGSMVRLNRDNYLLDNSGNTKEITIKDAVEEKPVKEEENKSEPVKEETVEEIVGQDPIEEQKELKEDKVKGEKLPDISNEEKEAPAVEEKAAEAEKAPVENKTVKNNNQRKKK